MAAGTVVVDPAWAWVWRAWWRLHRGDRVWVGGMGAFPQPIAWTSVCRWARHYGYGPQDAAFLDACVFVMDEVFLKHHAEQERIRAEKRGK